MAERDRMADEERRNARKAAPGRSSLFLAFSRNVRQALNRGARSTGNAGLEMFGLLYTLEAIVDHPREDNFGAKESWNVERIGEM